MKLACRIYILSEIFIYILLFDFFINSYIFLLNNTAGIIVFYCHFRLTRRFCVHRLWIVWGLVSLVVPVVDVLLINWRVFSVLCLCFIPSVSEIPYSYACYLCCMLDTVWLLCRSNRILSLICSWWYVSR